MSDSSNDLKKSLAPSNLLLADLQHFGESMWQNEEIGEKRFNFFLSLVTAVVAGLVALTKLWISDPDEISDLRGLPDSLRTIISVALFALLLFGIMTYLRMLQRNRVTDEYQRTLSALRQRYVKLCPSLQPYHVPLVRKPTRPAKWLRGGYAETVGVINGILCGLLMFALNAYVFVIIAVSVLVVALQWRFAVVREKGSMNQSGQSFRAGVGAVIFNARGEVLALERSDIPGSWQLPQGGLQAGEEPADAVLREIAEETSINAAGLDRIEACPEPLAYELPPGARSEKTGRGQVQYWFLFRFTGDDRDIDVSRSDEFRAWRWTPFSTLVDKVVRFRAPIYGQLMSRFEKHLLSASP